MDEREIRAYAFFGSLVLIPIFSDARKKRTRSLLKSFCRCLSTGETSARVAVVG